MFRACTRGIMLEKIGPLDRKLCLLPICIWNVDERKKAEFFLRLLSDSDHLSTICSLFAKLEIFSS